MFSFVLGAVGGLLLLGVVTAVEFIAPIERYSLKSRLKGLLFWTMYLLIGGGLFLTLQALWQGLGIQPLVIVPMSGLLNDVTGVIAALLISDFVGYWHHRALHRFFWPIHAVHHSQTELNAANGYGHFLEKVTYFFFAVAPFSFIQFQTPALPIAVAICIQVLEHYIHSPTTAHFGPLAKVLVDNRFHRIHHSIERRHFDKNFGIIFPFWDRIFGTACHPEKEWPATGVMGSPPPRSIVEYLAYPLRVR